MDPSRWQRISTLFAEATRRPPEERLAFLDEACGSDLALRHEVQRLLDADIADGTFLSPPAGANAADQLPTVALESARSDAGAALTLDGYEVVRELHRGGQGIVFQAVQQSTRRKVAIKVLLEGPHAAPAARRRFDREIELVASLKHPNIISIFHSGTTGDRHAFCVMDYVRGVSLTEYVRREQPNLEDALRLFVKVCDAVNYAHQRGVIHRDLKPSNILVDGEGEPKVLDFGLAKLIGGPEQTLVSLTGQVVGTLPYMSPEQTQGNPDRIDTRTDVYSLGVVLYEMLTGQYPYPVVGQLADVLRHITETEPAPPTRCWRADSGIRKRSARRWRAGECPIDDEVQTIVLRTLAKERERRYQSAGELARDVERYLVDEPIEAKRDSGWYLLRKQLRRYRWPVTVAAGFLALIIIGLAVSLNLWMAARAARIVAEQAQRKEAEQRAAAIEHAEDAQAARAEAEYQAFLANLSAASQALDQHELRGVRRRLAAIPDRLHRWEWNFLNAAADDSIAVLEGHTAEVRQAAFSPDGARVVTAADDGTARVWEMDTAEAVRVLTVPEGWLHDAVFSPDGARIITAGGGPTRIWDASTGAELLALGDTAANDSHAEFSPDGTQIVAAGMDGVIRVWNVQTGTRIVSLSGHRRGVNHATFSRDGTRVVSSSWDGTARVWNPSAETSAIELHAPPSVLHATFSPDARRIVTSNWDSVQLWNSVSGTRVSQFTTNDGTARLPAQPVAMAVFTPDNKRFVAVTGADPRARICDAGTGAVLATLVGHADGILHAAVSPDGTMVATAALDGTVRLWDTATGAPRAVLHGHTGAVNWVAFSPNGERIITAAADDTARLWDIATALTRVPGMGSGVPLRLAEYCPDGACILTVATDGVARLYDATTHALLTRLADRTAIRSVSFSRNGARLLTTSDDSTVRIWNALTAALELTIDAGTQSDVFATIDSNGTRAVTAAPDSMHDPARLWDLRTGRQLALLSGGAFGVGFAAFSPNGQKVVTVSRDGDAHLWDAATGAELARLPGQSGLASPVFAAFSPDGTKVLCVGDNEVGAVWSVADGAALFSLQGHSEAILHAAFSPDGQLIATASSDATARVWNSVSGAPQAVLAGHENAVTRVGFSPDGDRLLTCSDDGTLRDWDPVTGAELLVLRAHDDAVGMGRFNIDGSVILTVSPNGTCRIWDSHPPPVRCAQRHAYLRARAWAATELDALVAQSPDWNDAMSTIRQSAAERFDRWAAHNLILQRAGTSAGTELNQRE
ncbi:MAG TPA: protein kinase [Phycisphaerae bacterium]|nr:protein kinase [Phycisphaerae bacterium]